MAKGRSGWKSARRITLESPFAPPRGFVGNAEKIFAVQLDLFQKYQRAMAAMARDQGVRTACFFHPVPGYGKALTAPEKAVAGDLSHVAGDRRMVNGMLTQRALGLAVFDLGDLLADVPETVYADSVHFQRAEKGESLDHPLMARRRGVGCGVGMGPAAQAGGRAGGIEVRART